jgi:hypothetical protein
LKDTFGPIGDITTSALPSGVSFTTSTRGVSILNATGGNPDEREAKLNDVAVYFQPRPHYSAV